MREVDDAFALILAFHSPEVWIAGISSTYGNAALKQTTRIARDLVERFAREKCEVHQGARSRADGDRSTEATRALAAALQQERLTYIALGPLTNLAAFLRLHPELEQRIDRIVMVGGQTFRGRHRIGKGGWLRIHDANVFKDPRAVVEVLKSTRPISLAPIETSISLQVTRDHLREIRGTTSGEFLYRHTGLWSWFWRHIIGLNGGPIFDALPFLAAIRPDLVSRKELYALVDETSCLMVEEKPERSNREVTMISALHQGADEFVRARL